MQPHKIVSREEWIEARKAHMAHEKEFTRARDASERGAPRAALGQGRQGLCVRRPERQGDARRSVQGPARSSWCSMSCSRPTGTRPARAARSGPTVSSAWSRISPRATPPWSRSRCAPLDKLEAFKKRMGWTFDWVSSGNNDFNYDYGVSFTREQIDAGDAEIQFRHHAGSTVRSCPASACSIATRPATSSTPIPCFARGLDMMNAAYQYLDLTPLGRHEEGLPYPMDWVRLRDQYEPEQAKAACCHG